MLWNKCTLIHVYVAAGAYERCLSAKVRPVLHAQNYIDTLSAHRRSDRAFNNFHEWPRNMARNVLCGGGAGDHKNNSRTHVSFMWGSLRLAPIKADCRLASRQILACSRFYILHAEYEFDLHISGLGMLGKMRKFTDHE